MKKFALLILVLTSQAAFAQRHHQAFKPSEDPTSVEEGFKSELDDGNPRVYWNTRNNPYNQNGNNQNGNQQYQQQQQQEQPQDRTENQAYRQDSQQINWQ